MTSDPQEDHGSGAAPRRRLQPQLLARVLPRGGGKARPRAGATVQPLRLQHEQTAGDGELIASLPNFVLDEGKGEGNASYCKLLFCAMCDFNPNS